MRSRKESQNSLHKKERACAKAQGRGLLGTFMTLRKGWCGLSTEWDGRRERQEPVGHFKDLGFSTKGNAKLFVD